MPLLNRHRLSIVEVFDSEYKFVKEIPSPLVRHLPAEHHNISRFVLCRNYAPGQDTSCSLGDECKCVHADLDERTSSRMQLTSSTRGATNVCAPTQDILRVM